MTNMTIIEQTINGKKQICQVTPYERNLIAAGRPINIPASRRVTKRLGMPRAMQLSAKRIALQPVIF